MIEEQQRVSASPGGRSFAPCAIGSSGAQILLPRKRKRWTMALPPRAIYRASVRGRYACMFGLVLACT
jgi:hypothetical protein